MGTLHGDRALHPNVGSLWLQPAQREPFESTGEISEFANREDKRDSLSNRSIPDGSAHPAGDLHPTTELTRVEPSDGGSFTPLVSPSKRVAVPAAGPSFAPERSQFPPASPSLSPGSDLIASPLPHGDVAAPKRTLQSKANTFPRQARQTETNAAGPDTIEIHIGRIEVLAAPPKPIEQAPRTTAKSLDLGEYLRGERRLR